MPRNSRLVSVLLAIAGVMAVVESQRVHARRSAPGRAAALLENERAAITERLRLIVASPRLLAALAEHRSAPEIARAIEAEPSWQNARRDRELARVVSGGEALATVGTLALGAGDRDVVAEARRAGTAWQIAIVDGWPCALVAGRLAALPDLHPVLVLAKIGPDQAAGKPGAIDLLLIGLACAVGVAGFALLVMKRRPRANQQSGQSPPAKEEDANAGAPPSALPRDPSREIAARDRRATPPPPGSPPAGPRHAYPRHPTAPDGTPIAADGSGGKRFGRYQLLNPLGEGGMAEVFTAVSHGAEGFSRVFVVKRLRRELAHDKEAIAQFIDEARLQSGLVHSNIVPVFDFGRMGDEYYMTQEYIVGRDLSRLVEGNFRQTQQTLDPRITYHLAFETLQALHYAHTRRDRDGQPLGIVHRDVSPGNIILSAQGEVKLADFGIVTSNRRVSRTQAGMVKGNANFMSPEQARGQPVDARSDLFSLGLVMFFALTNRYLYDGANDLEVLFKAASGPLENHLAHLIEPLPSPVREILARALAVDPAERFQSAAEFASALGPLAVGAKSEAAELMRVLFGDELQREAA
jgi:hypothetical protein